MRQLPLGDEAMGGQPWPCCAADDLEQAAVESLTNLHPDAGIITSFPGLDPLTSARALAELSDDRSASWKPRPQGPRRSRSHQPH